MAIELFLYSSSTWLAFYMSIPTPKTTVIKAAAKAIGLLEWLLMEFPADFPAGNCETKSLALAKALYADA